MHCGWTFPKRSGSMFIKIVFRSLLPPIRKKAQTLKSTKYLSREVPWGGNKQRQKYHSTGEAERKVWIVTKTISHFQEGREGFVWNVTRAWLMICKWNMLVIRRETCSRINDRLPTSSPGMHVKRASYLKAYKEKLAIFLWISWVSTLR